MVIEVHANESLSIKEVIVGVRSTQKKELKKYSIYQPHSTFLFIPIKKWLYQLGEKHFYPEKIQAKIIRINRVYQSKIDQAINEKDKIKLIAQRDRLIKSKERALAHGNRFMRMGEKPMAYNRIYVQQNEKIFLDYLHSKGYLDAIITTQTDFKKNSVCVTYRIQQGHAYKISSIELDIKDPSIKEILLKHVKESFIKKNNPYQYQDFINEQERIITLLSNNGYFEFNEAYCHFTAEVSQNDHTIAITTVIEKPDNQLTHNKIKVGRVIVDLTPKNKTKGQTTLLTKECQGIVFLIESAKHLLKDLVHKIAIRPGDFYDKSKILETSERLHRLGIFESITIFPKKEANHLVIYIYLKPYERVIVQTEIGGECINLNLKRLRPTIKIIPTIRQLFGGLGIVQIETNVSLSEQLTGKKQAFYKHLSCGLRLKYTTPHFLLPLPERAKVALEDFSPNTAVHIGFNYIHNPIYTRKKTDSELIYDWRHRDKNISYQFSPCKISYIHPKVIDKNAQYKLENNILIPSFLTSIGFASTIKDTTANEYLDVLNRYKWIFSIGVEHGGLYEKIFSLKKIFPRKFQFYQYIKLDLDHRRSFNLTEDTMVVCQTKLGVNIVYGENDIVHPDKQYQAGGYSGVRAWDTHKIGPGYCQSKKNKIREGNGDLLLLGNIELRQKLIGFLEGALFVDIGNTWSLSRNAPMEAKFNFNNFYKAFAIGGGFGLRLNFYNTFVLCGDVAIKLRSPSGLISQSKLVNFNLTIGYPF
ncbi:BamA/TamA family outer membrane protein [Cardinium endosymbiont of Culicoides punctatus]|uniref:BamA/TamA family outer membrane protein n=1 Tax=Cardinium endosymbiont of Culicoides punctatus TaxID=2304601 RepID=UPI001058882C|nr:BamA/TamA family outer membrane protein [Cardinium endosymbiont of Culicoides punctatus]TDG93359.1 Outer membrane protein assembly factor BamA [Cardinium endosymbiont of Culicoides punctatus]